MRFWLLFVGALLVADEQVLSKLQRDQLALDRQKAEVEASKLATSWINPITMSYTYQKGDQFPNQRFESFVISIDQPIFKSLGIWEAIRYAHAKRGESLKGVELRKKELIAQVYRLAFTYKKQQLQLKRERLALENARIDVLVKKEQYRSGELDGTFLDNAILKKNQLALSIVDLENSLAQTERSIKDLSDLNPAAIPLPTLKLVSKEHFFQRNLELAQLQKAKSAARHMKRMTIARYLPQVSLFYNYNYQKSQGSQFFPDYRYQDHFFTYGLHIAMPLFDINSLKNIESAKIDYLKSAVQIADKKRALRNLYQQTLRQLRLLERKIELTKEDIALYEELVQDTKDRVAAGEKTIYDLKIMQNSLKQKRIDLEIFAIERQILLLDLYKRMDNAF